MFRILQNDERRSHRQFVRGWLSGSTDGFIAVAFLKQAGWRLIAEEVVTFLQRGGSLRMLVGTDFFLTDPESLRELLRLSTEHPSFEWRLMKAAQATFHPKYYRFRDPKNLWVMTGSANLTAGGLERNIETSVVIEDGADGRLAAECQQNEAALWAHPRGQIPTEELIGIYAAEYQVASKRMKAAQTGLAKELAESPKLEGEKLQEELQAYADNEEEVGDLAMRRENYATARNLILGSLLGGDPVTSEVFKNVYRHLVGERGLGKLWHSGSVYRSKTKVIGQWSQVMEMIREIAADLTRSPETMYELGLRWMDRIDGIGPNIFTEFCHTLAPERYAPLNDNPVTSLRWLKRDAFPQPSAFKPDDYGRFCRALGLLRERCGFADLGETDHFLNFVYWRHREDAKASDPDDNEDVSQASV